MKKVLLLSILTAPCFTLLSMEDDLKGRMERLPQEIKHYIQEIAKHPQAIDQKDLESLLPSIIAKKTHLGHSNWLSNIAISPDGKYIVKGWQGDNLYFDKTAEILDASNDNLIHTLEGHRNRIAQIAISPDGKYIVTSSWDDTAIIWDLNTGKRLHTLLSHFNWVNSIAISPDGTYVVTGSQDKTAKVWNLKTGELLHTLSTDDDPITSIAISPDSKYVVTGSYTFNNGTPFTVNIWDLINGTLVYTLPSGKSIMVGPISVTSDGKYLVTSSIANIKIWNFADGKLEKTLNGQQALINSVEVNSDGKYLLKGYANDSKTIIENTIFVVKNLNDIARLKLFPEDKKNWPEMRVTFLLKLIKAVKNEEHLILHPSDKAYEVYTTMFDKRTQDALAPFIRIK